MDLKVGSMLIYGNRGVCRVDDIRKECFVNSEREYYVLKPINDARSVVYVPVDSDRIQKYAKNVVTQEEIQNLIGHLSENPIEWIDDNKARGEYFKQVLETGGRTELLELIRTIYIQKQKLFAAGKKLNVADENAFVKAERLIHGEFAYVLGIPSEKVAQYICNAIDGSK